MILYCCNPLILQPEQSGGVWIRYQAACDELRGIATYDLRLIVESGVLQTCICYHYLVHVVRKYFGLLKPQHKMIATRQMKNFYEERFLTDLASVEWQALKSFFFVFIIALNILLYSWNVLVPFTRLITQL